MLRAAAILGLLVGVGLAAAETALNWGNWQWWPYFAVDYIAAVLLAFGALSVFRGGTGRLLSAGFGFAAGMAWMSFFSHIEAGGAADRVEGLTIAIGVLLAASVIGMIMSFTSRDR